MNISLKELKILWGRAAGHCSLCNIKLSEDKEHANGSFPLGEQAHIVAEESTGPRGQSVLNVTERNSYSNLILLCPTCHTRIDKNPEDFPIEKLHQQKTEHELRVQGHLSALTDTKAVVANTLYGHWIDTTVDLCQLREWRAWFSSASSCDPSWKNEHLDSIDEYRRSVSAAVWPGGLPELERSIQTLSLSFTRALQIFWKHSAADEGNKGWYTASRFYRYARNGQEEYDQLLEEYESWIDAYNRALNDVTKAANWFAALVRRDCNPMFFATEGRFINNILYSKQISPWEFEAIHEFTTSEKRELPSLWFPKG